MCRTGQNDAHLLRKLLKLLRAHRFCFPDSIGTYIVVCTREVRDDLDTHGTLLLKPLDRLQFAILPLPSFAVV